MDSRLGNIVQQFLVREGAGGKAQLCLAVKKSEQTLVRWIKSGVPTQHDAYRIALACGCSDEEALSISQEECPSEEAKEPA